MMMAQDPYLIRDMARHLAAELRANGLKSFEVRAEAFATLNGRPSQPLIDPQADLAGELAGDWILALNPIPKEKDSLVTLTRAR